jgi:hypothetical protein
MTKWHNCNKIFVKGAAQCFITIITLSACFMTVLKPSGEITLISHQLLLKIDNNKESTVEIFDYIKIDEIILILDNRNHYPSCRTNEN